MKYFGLLLIFFATSAFPQERAARVLLPVVATSPVAGAFGSLWQSHIAVTNTGTSGVVIRGYIALPHGCGIPQCLIPPTPPGITFFPRFAAITRESPARFLLVNAEDEGNIQINLRIQDMSRQLFTWGTTIPTVREDEYFTTSLDLLDIPGDDRFRWTLRIYERSGDHPVSVRVRYYATSASLESAVDVGLPQPPSPDRLLHEQTVPLLPQSPDNEEQRHSYAEISSLGTPLILQHDERLRIEVAPLAAESIWAFLAVTNNETQHVTVVAPQK